MCKYGYLPDKVRTNYSLKAINSSKVNLMFLQKERESKRERAILIYVTILILEKHCSAKTGNNLVLYTLKLFSITILF